MNTKNFLLELSSQLTDTLWIKSSPIPNRTGVIPNTSSIVLFVLKILR